jgi:Protein of unknown function (DUF2937).
MKIGRAFLGTGEKLLDRALCVAGAVIFSQAPEFMQQYLQRLGGHLDEARRQLEQFRRVAAQSGLSLEQFIAKTNANADAAVAKLGGVMSEASVRVEQLETAQSAIMHASPLTRPFAFIRHVDTEIANATWSIFKPAVPTTLEGLLYALIGMAVFLGIYHGLIKTPCAGLWARYRARKVAPQTA